MKDFYGLSMLQLMVICDASLEEVQVLTAMLSAKITKTPTSALELLRRRSDGLKQVYISTGMSKLDEALGGGLAVGTIVEVCGAPGIGKSQFCLSCCASVLLGSTMNSVIYFDTELKFSAERLVEILGTRHEFNAASNARSLLGRVNVKRILSVKELYESIEDLQSEVISGQVGLVIIDSMAALARKEGLNSSDKNTFLIKQV